MTHTVLYRKVKLDLYFSVSGEKTDEADGKEGAVNGGGGGGEGRRRSGVKESTPAAEKMNGEKEEEGGGEGGNGGRAEDGVKESSVPPEVVY